MALIQYAELTDFQKWFFFYVIVHGRAPKTLDGVTREMCLTVKMNIDVDNYDQEQKRLQREADVLVRNGLLDIDDGGTGVRGDYVLTDKGELYVFQKILGPIVRAKEQGKANEIIRYFAKDGGTEQTRITQLLQDMNPSDQKNSLMKISKRVLSYAMPTLNAIDRIHTFARSIGLIS